MTESEMGLAQRSVLTSSVIGIMAIVSILHALRIVWSIDWETINVKTNVIIIIAREMAETA